MYLQKMMKDRIIDTRGISMREYLKSQLWKWEARVSKEKEEGDSVESKAEGTSASAITKEVNIL